LLKHYPVPDRSATLQAPAQAAVFRPPPINLS
jgi:hypothetical protein